MKKAFKTVLLILLVCILFQVPLHAELKGKVDLKKPLLKVVFLDVWQGDSILLIFPNKKSMLIDGGSGGNKYSRFDAGRMVINPYLKKNHISSIHDLVMTHPHSDHIGGLVEVLKAKKIDNVFDCGMSYTTELYLDCLTLIDKKKINYNIPSRGDKIKVDPLVDIKVLHPGKDWSYSDNPNNNSIVIKVKYKKVSFLFTGDIEEEVEYNILDSGEDLSATVLKVPHHGSDTSSSDAFLSAVDPETAVIMVGKNNKFGHPTPSILASYEDRNIKLFRTDYDGDVTFITDGSHYEVKSLKRREK
ncbi:MAG: MBL fold metallo-hydrolase [Spirochaetes bacterium]|nr:MBL fold metallo-hydrolase [Spirochaetota bacterium]